MWPIRYYRCNPIGTGMYFSLSQAAKETGKSKTTLSRYIKNGKLSCTSKDDGGYQIEASELFRVFPPVTEHSVSGGRSVTTCDPDMLQQKTEFLECQLREKEKIIADLQADKAFLQAQLQTTTHLLEDRRRKPPTKPVQRFKWPWARDVPENG